MPLLQLAYLLLSAGDSAKAISFWHIICWTPQILWGICANGLLIGLLINRKRVYNIRSVLWIPAAMVLGCILILRFLFGVSPFAHLAMSHHPEEYADAVLPSMWMLAGLGLLYGWALFLQRRDTRDT